MDTSDVEINCPIVNNLFPCDFRNRKRRIFSLSSRRKRSRLCDFLSFTAEFPLPEMSVFVSLCISRTMIQTRLESDLLSGAPSTIFIRFWQHRFHFWQWPLPGYLSDRGVSSLFRSFDPERIVIVRIILAAWKSQHAIVAIFAHK